MSSNEYTLFAREIREILEQNDILAIISSEDEEKVVHVEKIKVVRRDGKRVLKITTSVEELEASGNYAENSVNLELPEGNVTLFVWIGGGIGPVE
jgi:O-glycosyl hydrolase